MRVEVLGLDPSSYEPHPLHMAERCWTETNCYVDLWIEVLHSLGVDPVAAGACTLSTDFEGDQWTMFKFPNEDLRALFGLEIAELNVWRPLVDHVREQLAMGHLLTVDVDAWYLPDTAGVSYRSEHQKTTLMPQMIDVDNRTLGYFHNAGYFELIGEDFDGVLGIDKQDDPSVLPPYVETVRIDRLKKPHDGFVDVVRGLAREHLARRPSSNPMWRFKERLEADLDWLSHQPLATFHRYAFGTCRQCGSAAELAGSFVEWLDRHDAAGLDSSIDAFRRIAMSCKALQFRLARVVSGRSVDLDAAFGELAEAWEAAMEPLVARYGD